MDAVPGAWLLTAMAIAGLESGVWSNPWATALWWHQSWWHQSWWLVDGVAGRARGSPTSFTIPHPASAHPTIAQDRRRWPTSTMESISRISSMLETGAPPPQIPRAPQADLLSQHETSRSTLLETPAPHAGRPRARSPPHSSRSCWTAVRSATCSRGCARSSRCVLPGGSAQPPPTRTHAGRWPPRCAAPSPSR